jgi:hypothetical protein
MGACDLAADGGTLRGDTVVIIAFGFVDSFLGI